ncbi:hypothetical protein MCEMIH15_01485 [Caulobacteraceae bacterium]
MAYFVVTYDLIQQKDYETLTDELTRIGGEKAALSVWLVEQNLSALEMRKHLQGFVDDDDKLIVVEFSKKPSWTKAFTKGVDWINARFS